MFEAENDMTAAADQRRLLQQEVLIKRLLTSQQMQEVLPKAGLVYSEKGNLSEVLCKPKIMPIKSLTLEKIEDMEAQAARQPSIPATALGK